MNLKRRIRGWIGGLAAVALVPGGGSGPRS
jgi:hypothetical protein